jgi:hypothetical protein
MDPMELEARGVLADWSDLNVRNMGPFWLIAGNDPQGVRRAGTRDDVVSLAHTLAEQGRYVEPEPEPVSADISATEPPALAPYDPSAVPAEDEGGSLLDDLLGAGIGVMVNNTGGVMASDQTEILRSFKFGEVVDQAEDLLEMRFNDDHHQRWQQLWSQSLGVESNASLPLTEEEQHDLDDLGVRERWAASVKAEQQARVAALRALTTEQEIRDFNTRGGWPQ